MDNDMKTINLRDTFRRVVISQTDLIYARAFADIIIGDNLHGYQDRRQTFLHRGLNTALVVTYSRPFTKNDKDKSGGVRMLPEKYYWHHYTERERMLHSHVITLRNEVHAHSDSGTVGPSISIDEVGGAPVAIPSGWNPYIPLSRSETEELASMIDKALGVLSEEHVRLQALFVVGDEF
jgi:hypothetical protein